MDDPPLVGRLHGPGQLLDEHGRLSRRQRRAGQLAGQAAAVADTPGEERQAVVLADLVDLHDIGMLQRGDGLGLGRKRDRSSGPAWPPARIIFRATTRFKARLPGLVDDAHAAAAQLAQHLVAGQGRQSRRPGAGPG